MTTTAQVALKRGEKRGDKETDKAETTDLSQGVNVSNEWRIYAKLEANYHLSNKYALFLNMKRYY